MASAASFHSHNQPAQRAIVIDPAITLGLLIAAAAIWHTGASVLLRGWFVGLLACAAFGLSIAASRRA